MVSRAASAGAVVLFQMDQKMRPAMTRKLMMNRIAPLAQYFLHQFFVGDFIPP